MARIAFDPAAYARLCRLATALQRLVQRWEGYAADARDDATEARWVLNLATARAFQRDVRADLLTETIRSEMEPRLLTRAVYSGPAPDRCNSREIDAAPYVADVR